MLSDTAEELYKKIGQILERIQQIETSIEDSSDRLDDIERRLARQEALLEALAEANDVDVSAIEMPEVAEDEPAEDEADATEA